MPNSAKPSDPTDWPRLRAMTDAEAEANAIADPDNPPQRAGEAARNAMPRIAVIRRALRLTQAEFSARYHIPLGTLRDWEQGRAEPDQAARAYIRVIAAEPERTAAIVAGGRVA